jgi:hypothetical protein
LQIGTGWKGKKIQTEGKDQKRFLRHVKALKYPPLGKKLRRPQSLPNLRRIFRRLTIQLSLGRWLLSRACFCFTGQAGIGDKRKPNATSQPQPKAIRNGKRIALIIISGFAILNRELNEHRKEKRPRLLLRKKLCQSAPPGLTQLIAVR